MQKSAVSCNRYSRQDDSSQVALAASVWSDESHAYQPAVSQDYPFVPANVILSLSRQKCMFFSIQGRQQVLLCFCIFSNIYSLISRMLSLSAAGLSVSGTKKTFILKHKCQLGGQNRLTSLLVRQVALAVLVQVTNRPLSTWHCTCRNPTTSTQVPTAARHTAQSGSHLSSSLRKRSLA